MARLSDIIEEFIKSLLSDDGEAIQIQRNELANKFSCAPSQINYVLTTRFTVDKGYIIESRRGGGGCIVIKQLKYDDNSILKKIILDKIGESITYNNSLALIDGLYDSNIITIREREIIKSAVNQRILVYSIDKNMQRAKILKSIIMIVLS
ncbi:CtsR family transcriptional regulator [Clostridium frigidicarnis]|uniref:Transcriptional regulator CtsR n=1 Tax=Clostridium frigidicarnis TaxID=84698 RepID=A0A1I1AAA7_9CLOT|nr:CtsR family transcriptional regulator [Clostridium frigidicarnis]SFB34914.1 transcriptional regulator CtsR [Clostridium frigidicarnis]